MIQKEEGKFISQPNIFNNEFLDDLGEIVKEYPYLRATIVPKLKLAPIPKKERILVQYYKLDLSKDEAENLLHVIRTAQLTNDKKPAYNNERLLFLLQKWQKYCESLG